MIALGALGRGRIINDHVEVEAYDWRSLLPDFPGRSVKIEALHGKVHALLERACLLKDEIQPMSPAMSLGLPGLIFGLFA